MTCSPRSALPSTHAHTHTHTLQGPPLLVMRQVTASSRADQPHRLAQSPGRRPSIRPETHARKQSAQEYWESRTCTHPRTHARPREYRELRTFAVSSPEARRASSPAMSPSAHVLRSRSPTLPPSPPPPPPPSRSPQSLPAGRGSDGVEISSRGGGGAKALPCSWGAAAGSVAPAATSRASTWWGGLRDILSNELLFLHTSVIMIHCRARTHSKLAQGPATCSCQEQGIDPSVRDLLFRGHLHTLP